MKKIISLVVIFAVTATTIVHVMADNEEQKSDKTFNDRYSQSIDSHDLLTLGGETYFNVLSQYELDSNGDPTNTKRADNKVPYIHSQFTIGYLVGVLSPFTSAHKNASFFFQPRVIYDNVMKDGNVTDSYTLTTKQDLLVISSVPYEISAGAIGKNFRNINTENDLKFNSNFLFYMKNGTNIKIHDTYGHGNVICNSLVNKNLYNVLGMNPYKYGVMSSSELASTTVTSSTEQSDTSNTTSLDGYKDISLWDLLSEKPNSANMVQYKKALNIIFDIITKSESANNGEGYIGSPDVNVDYAALPYMLSMCGLELDSSNWNNIKVKDPTRLKNLCEETGPNYQVYRDGVTLESGKEWINWAWTIDEGMKSLCLETNEDGITPKRDAADSEYERLHPLKFYYYKINDGYEGWVPADDATFADFFLMSRCTKMSGTTALIGAPSLIINPITVDIIPRRGDITSSKILLYELDGSSANVNLSDVCYNVGRNYDNEPVVKHGSIINSRDIKDDFPNDIGYTYKYAENAPTYYNVEYKWHENVTGKDTITYLPLLRKELYAYYTDLFSNAVVNDDLNKPREVYQEYNEESSVLESLYIDCEQGINYCFPPNYQLNDGSKGFCSIQDVGYVTGTKIVETEWDKPTKGFVRAFGVYKSEKDEFGNIAKGIVPRGQLIINPINVMGLVGGGGNSGGKAPDKPVDPKGEDPIYIKTHGVEWNYDNTTANLQYAEIKNGKDEYKERFEVMAGVPSKENLHLSAAAPSLLAKTKGVTYPVERFKGESVGGAKYLVNIPYYTTDNSCIATITLSGETSGSLTLSDGSEATLNSWVDEQKNAIMQWCADNHIKGKHTWTVEEQTMDDGGYDEEPQVTQENTITLPGCCFADGNTKSFTIPAKAYVSHSCDGGSDSKEGNWTITVTFNHQVNGHMGCPNDWQDFVETKYDTDGGTATGTKTYDNSIHKNPNNYSGNQSQDKNDGKGDYSKAGSFNHIEVGHLMLEPKLQIYTEGNLWTSRIDGTPDISVLGNTQAVLGGDADSFKFPKDIDKNIGCATQVVFHKFEKDIDRFSIDLPNNFEHNTVDLKQYGQNEDLDRKDPIWKNDSIDSSHYLRGLLTPGDKVVHSPGWTVSVEEGGTAGTNLTKLSMNGTSWHGGLRDNKRLPDLFNGSGGIKSELKTTLSSNIDQFIDAIKETYKKASTFEDSEVALFFSTDKLHSDAQMFNLKYRDVSVLNSGYFLFGEWGDKVTDCASNYANTEGKYDSSTVPNLEDRINSLTLTGEETLTLGLPVTGLKSKDELNAEDWDRSKAYQMLNCHGRERQYYSCIGYNGWFRLSEGTRGQSSKKLKKFSGIGITSSGEAAFYMSNGMLHCFAEDCEVTPDKRFPELSMHKFNGNHYQEAVQVYTKTDENFCTDRLITMDEKIEQGEHDPLSSVTFNYVNPNQQYLTSHNGTSKSVTSRYINDNLNFGDVTINADSINSIFVRNPSSVQFCRILCNPEYMDMRIKDSAVYKGGESRDLDYNNKQQDIDPDNIKYTDNNENRLYYNYNTKDWDEDVANRRKTVNFINVGSEFQMLYSDRYDITLDQYDAKRPVNQIDIKQYGVNKEDADAIHNEDDEPIQCSDLWGLSEISSKILGFGWGKEGCDSAGNNYSSAFPTSDLYNEGTHNYVVTRNVIIPFDCTLLNYRKEFKTYKADTLVDINDLYQWLPDNELGLFSDLSSTAIEDCEINNEVCFKFKGMQHPEQYDDGTANDNVSHSDRLIYGLCLLSNNEQVNVRTGFYQACLPAKRELSKSDVEKLKTLNYFMYEPTKDGSTSYGRIDIVGSIGNLTLNDVGDFRFSNLFKEPIAGTWLIQGSVKGVDTAKPNKTMQLPNNILGDKNYTVRYKDSIVNGNTTGIEPHKENYIPLPITAYNNNNNTYRNVQLKLGYKQYFDIETFGNYNGVNDNTEQLTNRITVRPRYYLYDLDKNDVEELDLFWLDEDTWRNAASNKFDLATKENIGLTMSQTVEEIELNRANCTVTEKDLTTELQSKGLTDVAYITSGRDYITGTSNLQTLDQKNRDYIGSEKLRSYHTMYGSDEESCAQYVEDEFVEKSDPKNIGELNFAMNNQKYYFTIGCPSSILFVPTSDVNDDYTINHGDKSLSEYIDDLEAKYRKLNGVVIETLQVQAYGPVWSLELKALENPNDKIRINLGDDGENYKEIDLASIRSKIKGEPVCIGDLLDTSSADYNVRGLY